MPPCSEEDCLTFIRIFLYRGQACQTCALQIYTNLHQFWRSHNAHFFVNVHARCRVDFSIYFTVHPWQTNLLSSTFSKFSKPHGNTLLTMLADCLVTCCSLEHYEVWLIEFMVGWGSLPFCSFSRYSCQVLCSILLGGSLLAAIFCARASVRMKIGFILY